MKKEKRCAIRYWTARQSLVGFRPASGRILEIAERVQAVDLARRSRADGKHRVALRPCHADDRGNVTPDRRMYGTGTPSRCNACCAS